MRWCGPEVEVEGIVSLKTGGCPEDCHFCSQSGRFDDAGARGRGWTSRSLVEAAKQTATTGATEFCIVAAVRGPGRAADGAGARGRRGDQGRRSTSTSPARSASSPASRSTSSPRSASTATTTTSRPRARTSRNVVTTHTWEERWETLRLVREAGMEVCCGGIIGMGETLEQRAELAAQLADARPRRGAAELPRPAPGHAVRRPRADGRRATRCARSRRSGSRCRARCCASRAGGSSPSATSARGRACSAGSTR